jgi:hypothetical protein
MRATAGHPASPGSCHPVPDGAPVALFSSDLAPGTERDLSLRGSDRRSPEVRFVGGEGVLGRTQFGKQLDPV